MSHKQRPAGLFVCLPTVRLRLYLAHAADDERHVCGPSPVCTAFTTQKSTDSPRAGHGASKCVTVEIGGDKPEAFLGIEELDHAVLRPGRGCCRRRGCRWRWRCRRCPGRAGPHDGRTSPLRPTLTSCPHVVLAYPSPNPRLSLNSRPTGTAEAAPAPGRIATGTHAGSARYGPDRGSDQGVTCFANDLS